MISEAHMATGRWQITLRADTPLAVRQAVRHLGHIYITDARLDADTHGRDRAPHPGGNVYPGVSVYPDGRLLPKLARWAGVVTRTARGPDREISGHGLAWWLGHDDKGPVLRRRLMFHDADIAEVVTRLLTVHIRPGQLHDPPAWTFSGTIERWQTIRQALDYVLPIMGCEWRVTPDATLDVGIRENLFTAAPSGLVVRDGAWSRDLTVVDAVSIVDSLDASEWFTDLLLVGRSDEELTPSGDVSSPGFFLPDERGPHGDLAYRDWLVTETLTEEDNIGQRIAQLQEQNERIDRMITVDLADAHIEGKVEPGSVINIYDPDAGIYHRDNEVQHAWGVIWPVPLYVIGVDWPVTAGQGVYYTDWTGGVLDLTDHVEFEASPARMTVGFTLPQGLIDRQAVKDAQRARLRDDPLYMPDVVSSAEER